MPRGPRAFLTRGTEYVDLGEYAGYKLRARIQRRTLHIGVPTRRGFRVELARARPTVVEVSEPDGSVQVMSLRVPVDPWARVARRAALVAVGAWLLTRLVSRRRHTRK
jgi:hypothetical protein